jgi:hypothetical protein
MTTLPAERNWANRKADLIARGVEFTDEKEPNDPEYEILVNLRASADLQLDRQKGGRSSERIVEMVYQYRDNG